MKAFSWYTYNSLEKI